VLVLVVLGLCLYLPRLGSSGLWDPWEPKYAQAAREMADDSDWVIPHYRKDERLNKAPMTYWLIAASHAVLGVNESAARLPSALLAVLGAAALGFAFAARGRPTEGLVGGAALLTSPQWLLTGRFATPDMPLASFLAIALALVLLLPSAASDRVRRLVLVALILLVAAAGLTDWPRGLLLPAWVVLGWGALRWSWKGPAALVAVAAIYHAAQLSHSVPWNLAAVGLAVVLAAVILLVRAAVPPSILLVAVVGIALLVAPWFLVARHVEPNEFSLYRYKYAFNLGESVGEHTGPYAYVVRTVAVGGMPWCALAVIGLIAGIRPRKDDTAGVLAGALIGATLFFTLSEAKMGHFYAVIQPTVAGLAGVGAVTLMRRFDWSAIPAAVVLVATCAVVWTRPGRLLETATVKTGLFGVQVTLWVVVAVAAWALCVVGAKIRGRPSWLAASLVPAALLAGGLGLWLVPALAVKKSTKPLWESYLEHRHGDEPLAAAGRTKDSIFYYSDNSAVRLGKTGELREFLAGPGAKFLVVTPKALQLPQRAIPGRWEPLHTDHPSHWLVRYEPPE
jgi:4-amino-4-deoxy-L-arabinose transferase-like glycosyltransferase